MPERYTVEDWRRAVFRDPHISDSTRVLLLLLADSMSPTTLKVRVPRDKLARALNRSDRRLAERLREAVAESPKWGPNERACRLEHRLLDRVSRGQKHVMAEFQGLIPSGLSKTHVCPAENETPATVEKSQQDAWQPAENAAHVRPAENADSGSQQDARGSCLSRDQPFGTGRVANRSNEPSDPWPDHDPYLERGSA